MNGQRLDKWLFFTRLAKSRTRAARMIEDGKVRLNRVKCDRASQTIQADDVITVSIRGQVRVLRVLAEATRRGPAAEAQALYADLSPPALLQGLRAGSGAPAPGNPGRPSKRDRRALVALRRGGTR